MLSLMLLLIAILPEVLTVIIFLGTITATENAFIAIIVAGIAYAFFYYTMRRD